MADKVLKNVVEVFIDETSQEIARNFSADKNFQTKIKDAISSIIREDAVKSGAEEVSDITKIVNNGAEARKINLAIKNWQENNLEAVNNYRKEEFKSKFEKEIKKKNPNITEDQLNKSKEYANLVAENYFKNNELNGQKEAALGENSRILGPGAMENGWTDMQGIFNFLKKKPKEIKDIKEKYNAFKSGGLKDVILPENLRQVRSFENIMSALKDPKTNNLFSKTQKRLAWADRIDRLTGGWLSKTVGKVGEKIVSKIGNQVVSEFASNALGVLAKEGFKKGFTTVLNGILKGGVEKIAAKAGTQVAIKASQKAAVKVATQMAVKIGAKLGLKAGAQATLAAIAGGSASIPVVGWVVALVLLAVDVVLFLKKKIDKLIEKLGISTKRFFEENFGKVGGWLMRTSLKIVALPAVLIGSISFAIVLPILIAILGGISIFSLFQGGIVSSLVPPKGGFIDSIVHRENNDYVSPAGPIVLPKVNLDKTPTGEDIVAMGSSLVNKVCYYMGGGWGPNNKILGIDPDWGKKVGNNSNSPTYRDIYGLDCSGFVRWVYYQYGIVIPVTNRNIENMYKIYKHVSADQLQPGDIGMYSNFQHVGIYAGDGYWLQAGSTGSPPAPNDNLCGGPRGFVKMSKFAGFQLFVRVL